MSVSVLLIISFIIFTEYLHNSRITKTNKYLVKYFNLFNVFKKFTCNLPPYSVRISSLIKKIFKVNKKLRISSRLVVGVSVFRS